MTEFEKTGGTYRKEGLYLLPNLTLQEDGQAADIGVWGIRHRRYLKQHHRVLYYNLLTAGKRDSTNFYNNLNKLNAYFQTTVEQNSTVVFSCSKCFQKFQGS